ncbi:F-actin-capping protein subunit alpha [Globomyces sp. JEL0801]|nr:F-actin-capping protein subunit alpha [Globomyces sp. JEL0801]
MDSKMQNILERLEAAASRLEGIAIEKGVSVSSTSTNKQSTSPTGPALVGFDALISGAFADFLQKSNNIGGLVQDQAKLLAKLVNAQRNLISIASVSKKPDQKTLSELIVPLQVEIAAITELKDKNRPSPLFFHLTTVADGVPALGWVVIAPTPVPYIGDMKDAAQFYCNRVIKEHKDKDPSHVEWANSFMNFLDELKAYVKQHHTTGLTWNPKGGDAKNAIGAPTGGAAPPPPPAPTAAQLDSFSGPPKPAGPNPAALLGELSKGTSGLRKVDKSEMTHKNPELRATSVVPAKEAPAAPTRVAGPASKGPPKLALEGNKWVVAGENISILSAKSSEMNILVMNDAGEYKELPVAEQFRTVIRNGSLVTEAVEAKE